MAGFIFVGRQMVNADAIRRAVWNESNSTLRLWTDVLVSDAATPPTTVSQEIVLTGEIAGMVWAKLQGMGTILLNPGELGA